MAGMPTPGPLTPAVQQYTGVAERELVSGRWVMSRREIKCAERVLAAVRWPDPATVPGALDERGRPRAAWRLEQFHSGVGALIKIARRAPRGPLRELLTGCGQVLRPALDLTEDGLAPDPDDEFNPLDLFDAEFALGALRQVLYAGTTGELWY
jgi:hypothetical protein